MCCEEKWGMIYIVPHYSLDIYLFSLEFTHTKTYKMKTFYTLFALTFLVVGFMLFAIPDNPIQEDKYEQEMKQENMVALGYIDNSTIITEYIVDLPEEIGQAEVGDLLQIINWNDSIITLGFYPSHNCIDSTHKVCDGECECDGLGCK